MQQAAHSTFCAVRLKCAVRGALLCLCSSAVTALWFAVPRRLRSRGTDSEKSLIERLKKVRLVSVAGYISNPMLA
jgi:hypothetical protein